MSNELRIALLGFGAIARALVALIQRDAPHVRIVGAAKASLPQSRDLALLPADARFIQSVAELDELDADLVVECAGHAALAQFGPHVLQQGCDLLIASVGALADSSLEATLRTHAHRSGARILIPSGALGGLDVLSAARLGGLEAVSYVGRKPLRAWKGTRAEQLLNLDDATTSETLFFEGTARQAALEFPQNANVTAAVAIAGLGFDATRVQLIADPACRGNEHRVHAYGAFGSIEVAVRANTLPDNPKTSMLAPCSLARSILNLRETVALA